ncbi:exodeoxyribonuclease VII large subunit [Helicobacter cappadocius]|uniref:Exodeoxyribonuclease 7 large subunit n=1 Tax=Helicobacter cappadocius TaxID=3063998 RepID=A0AA90T512_9HELI|nr:MULTISPECIES: exodeoxyribonuclease VII large subunit [unclassified Helicobacter]MDO7252899.1 exodeoxyribonuclease VII large subunit [Helicobacter sp. faydin-H75]MDP2538943.1 exodeoxyribonuclease VII large subunit [Helicobacter sp. faydin-H76]
MNSQILSVSQINTQIKSLVETTFLNVSVEGEISNLTKHSSGHIYFSIKDETSSIRCVMFKGNTINLRFELTSGQKVIIYGGLSVYVPRGEYQIICKNIEPSGEGALSLAYEQLKIKLQAKGYFDTDRKKKIPLFPKKIALITSSTGAALQDMLRVAQNRWNLTQIVAINTLVQGEGAKFDIVKNIQYIDSFFGTKDAFDVIVIGRGGGSREDLWAFNEEILADSIFAAKTPIVSAVGHEIDFLISDFVADLRAPTPSACMEMILPDKQEWLLRLDEIKASYDGMLENLLQIKEQKIISLAEDFKHVSVEAKLKRDTDSIYELKNYLNKAFENLLYIKSSSLSSLDINPSMEYFLLGKTREIEDLKMGLEAKNPKNFIQSGYAQVIKEGKIISLKNLQKNDEIELVDTDTQLKVRVLDKIKLGEEYE